MKLLSLVPKDVFDRKLSRYRFEYVEAIGRAHPVLVTGPGWPTWDDSLATLGNVSTLMAREDGGYDAILAYKVGGLAGSPLPVILAYNEADDHAEVRREIVEDCGADLVCFHHANDLHAYRDLADPWRCLFHVPHGANPEVFRDYGQEKTLDLLVVGNLAEHAYPFRHRLARLAVHWFRKRGYLVEILPHPGYLLPPRDGTLVGEAYARKLHSAKIVFTCAMRYKYQLAKYAEIAMSRALPAGDFPDECGECLARMEQMVLRIEPWMTDAEITGRVEAVLDDPGELTRLTTQAFDLAHRELTTAWYAERFLRVVRPEIERRQIAARASQEQRWREAEAARQRTH